MLWQWMLWWWMLLDKDTDQKNEAPQNEGLCRHTNAFFRNAGIQGNNYFIFVSKYGHLSINYRTMQSQVTQLYDPLLGYVRNRVRNREDAEDLTQDVFLKLAKSDSNGIANLKSWVYAIAKNTITDYYRKKQLQTNTIEGDVFFNEEASEDAGRELSVCVEAFVNQLPEEYRELLTLSELKEIPQKEIAQRLDMNYVTVRSKIQRGRKKLKELLESCCAVLQGGKGSIMGFRSKTGCDNTSSCD